MKDAGAEAIAHLRGIARHLLEARHPSGRWFGQCLAEYQSGAALGHSLAAAFGLVPEPGHETWWRAEARQRRGELLRGIARDFFADELSTSRKAKAIAGALARYEAAGWLRHRAFKAPPTRCRGRIVERLFLVLKTGGGAPAERTIRVILAGSEPPPVHRQREA